MVALTSPTTSRLRAAPPIAAASAVIAVGALAWRYRVDDAYVLGRYARRIAGGLGHTFIDGPPTDGVTGPLGLLPGIVASALGGDAVEGSKVVGVLCAAVAAAIVARRAGAGSLGGARAWLCVLVACAGPTLAVWSSAGLETGIAALLATLAGLAASARARVDGATLGASIAGLAWLRPEMALFAAALVASAWTRDRRAALLASAIGAVGALGVVVYRLALFGDVLPLAVHAKPGEIGFGVGYVLRAVLALAGGLGVVALVSAGFRRRTRALALAIGAHAFAVLVAGGDWMPGFRLFAPVVPLYALCVAHELARLSVARGRAQRVGAALLAAGAIGVPLVDACVQIPAVRDAGLRREEVGAPLARALASEGDVVALVDVGFLTYDADFDVVDLGGITDPVIARLPGGHVSKEVGADLLESRGVDVIVLHASREPVVEDGVLTQLAGYRVERRVAALPWVRAHFRSARVVRYAPDYWYVVLRRTRPLAWEDAVVSD